MRFDEACAHLGVPTSATKEQARAAYRLRAQLLHPDKHAAATDALRGEAVRAMATLTAAWERFQQGDEPPAFQVPSPPDPHLSRQAPVPADDAQARPLRPRWSYPVALVAIVVVVVLALVSNSGGSKPDLTGSRSPAATQPPYSPQPAPLYTPPAARPTDDSSYVTQPGIIRGNPGTLTTQPPGILIPTGWLDSGLQNFGGPASTEDFTSPFVGPGQVAGGARESIHLVLNGGSNGLVHTAPGQHPNRYGWTPNLDRALSAVACTVTSHFRISAYEVGYACAPTVPGMEVNGVVRIGQQYGYDSLEATMTQQDRAVATRVLNSLATASQ